MKLTVFLGEIVLLKDFELNKILYGAGLLSCLHNDLTIATSIANYTYLLKYFIRLILKVTKVA